MGVTRVYRSVRARFRDIEPIKSKLWNLFGHHRRRIWVGNGRAHIEMRSLAVHSLADFECSLKQALYKEPGVVWLELNVALNRIIVAFDSNRISADTIVAMIDAIEVRYQVDRDVFTADLTSHPGDDEPIIQICMRIGADIVGCAAGLSRIIARRTPGKRQYDFAAILSVVDNTTHLRQYFVNRLGKSTADMVLGVVNPIAQGIGSGPVTPIIDSLFQVTQLLEAVARRRMWEQSEPTLFGTPEAAKCGNFNAIRSQKKQRRELPRGPIERYSEDAWRVSLGGFAVGLADTQDLKPAVTPLLDALPKPARYGREAYCAGLSHLFSRHGILCIDHDVLRLLDRVTCFVVDAPILRSHRWTVSRVYNLGTLTIDELYRQAIQLFDPESPFSISEVDGWILGPVERLQSKYEKSPQIDALLGQQQIQGRVLALINPRHHVEALLKITQEYNSAFYDIVQTIHQSELDFVLISDDPVLIAEARPTLVVSPSEDIEALIRRMKRDANQVICLFYNGFSNALSAADCSVGFFRGDENIPWGAHLMAFHDAQSILMTIYACIQAKRVAQQSTSIAAAGASIGALTAMGGLEKTPPQRVLGAVNGASILALFNGIRLAKAVADIMLTEPVTRNIVPWHALSVDQVLSRTDSRLQGLRQFEATQRYKAPEQPESRGIKLRRAINKELANPLTPVLAGGAAVSAVVGSVTDAGIVGAVIAINAIIGGLERYITEDIVRSLIKREQRSVQVLRDAKKVDLDIDSLVIGDIIFLKAGDVVPVDCRVLDCDGLEVDESMLTGESLPVSKNAQATIANAVNERTSMLYQGTSISVGYATGIVVATHNETEMARAIHSVKRIKTVRNGVEHRLEKFTDLTLPVATGSGLLLIALGIFRRQKLNTLVGPAVNMAVAAVPEGLPLLATAGELAAARRLSKQQVMVRNPHAMEALGRVDVVCVDKTGTLTEGRLQLSCVSDGTTRYRMGDQNQSIRHIVNVALRATPQPSHDDELPHATDRAIIDGAHRHGYGQKIDTTHRRIQELPFKSELGFHAVLSMNGHCQRVISIKGAPEEVLSRVRHIWNDGHIMPIDETLRQQLAAESSALATKGLRVLAVAERVFEVSGDIDLGEEDCKELVLYGFVGLSDPIRETSALAVNRLRQAGVDVVMITGDHCETARQIALEVKLLDQGKILSGADIERMSDTQLDNAIRDTTVIARATPLHKVRIVEALQRAGRTVAMTGDGGNDAAAIRLADVGIALGSRSTSAARDASDLVVTDERIETLVEAIIEGRAMWTSVRDAVSILVGGNLGEIIFMLLSGIVSSSPALNARQLLLINLLTDVAPAMAIAMRPPPDVDAVKLLEEGPDKSLGKALNRDILWRAAITSLTGTTAWLMSRSLTNQNKSATVSLVALIGAQLGQTLVAAKPDRKVMLAALGSLFILLIIIETPGLSHLFGCRPLGPLTLSFAISSSVVATALAWMVPLIAKISDSGRELIDGSLSDEDYFSFRIMHSLDNHRYWWSSYLTPAY